MHLLFINGGGLEYDPKKKDLKVEHCQSDVVNQQFNVFRSYKSQLKSFSKRNFDPFCRRNRIDYMIKDGDENVKINTTIGQLNFLRWAIDNLVIEYILKYYDIIVSGSTSNESIQAYNKEEPANIRKELKIDKNKSEGLYSVQISSWSKESDALKEKK